AQEAEEQTAYTANNLNQYTAIQEGEADAFVPTYDADGNQTLVKTSTGIWTVTYNAANRPTVFANEATGTVVECSYDSSGRRATKKVTVNGTVTLHQRYIYRGYLQIACCDLTRTAHPCLWLITWDPTQPIATRPLAIQKDGTWYTYGWDLTKNITEIFGTTGYIRTAYSYTPFGEVSIAGEVTQPIQWSSECLDSEIDLVYYNYRHFSPSDGRWMGRDSIGEMGSVNMYCFVDNSPVISIDYQGNALCCDKCSREGVTQAQVIIQITSQFGSPEASDALNTFSKVFNYVLKPSEKAFPPLKIVSKVYGSTVEAASEFLKNRSKISNDKGWVVHGKVQYTVCEYKRCLLLLKNKDLTEKETKWVRSGYIVPGQYEDAEQEVKSKLKRKSNERSRKMP
ncbi:MAG: hypothetical protein MR890_02485, partial [Akkermansia muciniphila]|nr:hypothetical protein [Akkermansia muciniphila]